MDFSFCLNTLTLHSICIHEIAGSFSLLCISSKISPRICLTFFYSLHQQAIRTAYATFTITHSEIKKECKYSSSPSYIEVLGCICFIVPEKNTQSINQSSEGCSSGSNHMWEESVSDLDSVGRWTFFSASLEIPRFDSTRLQIPFRSILLLPMGFQHAFHCQLHNTQTYKDMKTGPKEPKSQMVCPGVIEKKGELLGEKSTIVGFRGDCISFTTFLFVLQLAYPPTCGTRLD